MSHLTKANRELQASLKATTANANEVATLGKQADSDAQLIVRLKGSVAREEEGIRSTRRTLPVYKKTLPTSRIAWIRTI
jgi:hypothetical protein